MRKLAAEMGFSPAARSRVQIDSPDDGDDDFDEFAK
jgi:phage terminase small subunit